MLCSSCSETVKPIVACDIDGTLGQYHTHLARFAAGYLDITRADVEDKPLYTGDVPYRVWFCERFGVDETTFRQVKLAYRQGGLKRTMPAYGGADRIIRQWRSAGAEVWLTTTRPYLRLDGIDPDTRAWLRRHEIEYDGLLYDEDKYRVLAERVDPARVVAVVDDLSEQLEAARKVFGMGITIQRLNGYNDRDRHEGSMQVEFLSSIGDIVTDRLRRWRREGLGHAL